MGALCSKTAKPIVGDLTHEQLLEISGTETKDVVGYNYNMPLYLEQPPSGTLAAFITQPDPNDAETIRIACTMNEDDINSLNKTATKKGADYAYKVTLTFNTFSGAATLRYQADCSLK